MDLFVKSDLNPDHEEKADFFYRSDWSKTQNLHIVKRMKKVYKWIYENYRNVCTHIFGCTVTSIFELNTLKLILDNNIKKNLFAGYTCVYNNFEGMEKFVFLSGANNVFTIDLLEILANKDDDFDSWGMPNDVWLGMKFKHVSKSFLPRFDIQMKVEELIPQCEVGNLIEEAFAKGHYHIRVKSEGDRSKTDHIILMDIYRKIFTGLRPDMNALQLQLRTFGASQYL